MSYGVILSRAAIPHISTSCQQCHIALEFPVPDPLPKSGTLLQIRCFNCKSAFTHAFYAGQVASGSRAQTQASPLSSDGRGASTGSTPASARRGRKIGTQEKPLETRYYDVLGITVTATTEEVKKAYRETFRCVTYLLSLNIRFRANGDQASPG